MRAIHYYLHKIANRIFSIGIYLFCGFNDKKPGVHVGLLGKFKFESKIILAFWDGGLVHLGDQLFHGPIVKYLVQKYDVYVCGNSPLNEYFERLGAKAVSLENLKETNIRGALFISKDDMAYQVWRNFKSGNSFVGTYYGAMRDNRKVVVSLSDAILGALQKIDPSVDPEREMAKIDFSPISFAAPAKAFPELEGKKVLAFNNYVASNYTGITKREYILEEICRKKKEEGYAIVHIGSERDKQGDGRDYKSLVDYDLRGKLNPLDLFSFFSRENVKGVIGFDTYVMHVASLLRKDLYIVVRNEREKEIFRKRYIPMYPGAEDILKEYV